MDSEKKKMNKADINKNNKKPQNKPTPANIRKLKKTSLTLFHNFS